MKRPIPEGGLQVRYLVLSNLAMGGEILWNIFSNQRHLVSQVLIKKYLHRLSIKNMDEGASHKGTTLWKLCSQGWNFFKEQLYKIPGNGKRIRLWEDKIMGLQPLSLAPNILDLWNDSPKKVFTNLLTFVHGTQKGTVVTGSFIALVNGSSPTFTNY